MSKPPQLTLEHYTKIHHRDTYPAIDETLPQNSCKGRSIVITGAGTGIGKATALSFARAGATAIYIAARTVSNLEGTKAEVLKIAPECSIHVFQMDIANEAQVKDTFAKMASINGKPLDILISNAGYVAWVQKTSEASIETIWNHFEVNVKGSMLVCLEFLKHCAAHGATIVNVSSGAAVINFADGLSAYSAAKLAVVKLFDYVNREDADRGLRVFNLQPGIVPTAMSGEGKQNTVDTAELPGSYIVWLTTPDADFLKGRFMYSNWDIDELKANKEEIIRENLFTLTLKGMDSTEWNA